MSLCGHRLYPESLAVDMKCSSCGQENPTNPSIPHLQLCTSCGAKLDGTPNNHDSSNTLRLPIFLVGYALTAIVTFVAVLMWGASACEKGSIVYGECRAMAMVYGSLLGLVAGGIFGFVGGLLALRFTGRSLPPLGKLKWWLIGICSFLVLVLLEQISENLCMNGVALAC